MTPVRTISSTSGHGTRRTAEMPSSSRAAPSTARSPRARNTCSGARHTPLRAHIDDSLVHSSAAESGLLAQLPLGREQRVLAVGAPRRDLHRVRPGGVPEQVHEHDLVVVGDRHHEDRRVPHLDHAVDRLLAVGPGDPVLADPDPRVLVGGRRRVRLPAGHPPIVGPVSTTTDAATCRGAQTGRAVAGELADSGPRPHHSTVRPGPIRTARPARAPAGAACAPGRRRSR